ncbi:hypothetical protein V8F33_010307 [Rhypophila sp. PSN 637]
MADPISLVASIASVVTLAARTAKLITSITEELKGRKTELLAVGEEISSFCLVLDSLQSQLDRSPKSDLKSESEPDDASEAAATRNRGLETLLAGCARTLQSIQTLLGEIKDGHAKTGLGKIQAQLKYSSKKKSLEGLRELLDKYKATLNIALLVEKVHLLSISELRDDLRRAFEVIHILQAAPGVAPHAGNNEKQDSDSEVLRDYVHSSAKVLAESVGNKHPAFMADTAADSEEVFYGSFDEWLASFAPPDAKDGELKTSAQRLGFMREKRLEIQEVTSTTPRDSKVMLLQIDGLRKKGSTARHSERVEVDPDSMTFDLLQTLFKKGYTEICGFRFQKTGMHFGPITGSKAPYVVSITTGPSSFDPVSGFKINRDQRFIEYYNDYITHATKVYVLIGKDKMVATSPGFEVFRDTVYGSDALVLRDDRTGEHIPRTYISFRRTLRLPENNNARQGDIDADREYSDAEGLPAQMSAFPLFSVSSPWVSDSEEMAKMGGVFFPMFQREALSICFRGDGPVRPTTKSKEWVDNYDYLENYAVRMYAGAINVVSGQRGGSPDASGDMQQDFVVIPKQERLDGFCVGDGRIRQFVAMPMGKGYGVEYQLSGQEVMGGIQLEIAPRYKTSVHFSRVKTSCAGEGRIEVANEEALDVPIDLFLTPSEAGLMPGDVLLMQPLVDDWRQRTQKLTYNPGMEFPEREFFGSAPNKDSGFFGPGVRPTFLRELRAWMPDDRNTDGAIHVEVVPPISVPVSWNLWDVKPGRTRIRLSPFLDSRVRLNASALPQEAVSNLPKKGWDYTEFQSATMGSNREQQSDTPFYMPLYSLAQEDISLILRQLLAGAPGPFIMSLGVGAMRKQRIVESADKRMFAWEKSVVVHVHILNSVAFARATGLKPLPCPISWGEYAAARLPFYMGDQGDAGRCGAKAKDTDIALSLVKSVQELDIDNGIVWDVVLQLGSKATPTGCAFCETNLADTVLRPCNHVFCSACIAQWMLQADRDVVKCAFCETEIKTDDMVTFSGPTSTAQGEDRDLYGPKIGNQHLLEQTPANVFAQLTGWGRSYFEFGAENLTETLCKSIELADDPWTQDKTGRYATCTHPFDFVLANLWRVPRHMLMEYEDGRLLLEGLAAAAKGQTGYCLDRILPFLPPAHELDSFQPGRLGEILCDSCSYAERQTLKLLEWACKDGQANPDDWGMTVASAIWRASPAVVRRMLELGADPDATNDDPDEPRFGQGKSALHLVHDDVVENLRVLLEVGGQRLDVRVRDFNGRTPIHSVAQEFMTDTLSILLEQPGAKEVVDWKDEGGQTALGLLRKALYGDMAKKAKAERMLIQAGADPALAPVAADHVIRSSGSSLSLSSFGESDSEGAILGVPTYFTTDTHQAV